MRFVVPSLMLWPFLLTPAASVGARSDGAGTSRLPIRTSVTEQGVRLDLYVPHRSYPRDALIRVWARLQNVSRHDVWIWDGGPPAPGKYMPQVEVFGPHGHAPLPLSLTNYINYPGPGPSARPLKPGYATNQPEDIVLRGPRIRLSLILSADRRRAGSRPGWVVITPTLHLNLTSPDGPATAVQTQGGLTLDVTPVGPASGPLVAVYYVDCKNGGFQETFDWTSMPNPFTIACPQPLTWDVIAGWRGHTVAEVTSPT
jgi:hypothetical protein